MPETATRKAAQRDLKQGKAASTAAGEFVREEMDHIREGKHGARSTKQAIAIGLSKARRAGVPLKPQAHASSAKTQKSEERDYAKGQRGGGRKRTSAKRSRAAEKALKREPHRAASRSALSKQAHRSASQRGATARRAAARKAAATRKRRAS